MGNNMSRRAVTIGFLCSVSVVAIALESPRYGSWSPPVNLTTVNSTTGDFFPTVSKDGLSLYFTAQTCPAPTCRPDGFGGFDIYVSQRTTVDEPWGPPQNLGPTINTEWDEGAPSLSVDGHVMFFASDRPESYGGNDIFVSRRHNKGDDLGWQAAVNVGTGVNTSWNESSPSILENDATGLRVLYFDSNRPGGPGPFTDDLPAHNGNDIYVSVHQADQTFGPATLVAELSTSSFDRQPAVRRDGLEIYFTSNRPGSAGLDLWVATRAATQDPWSAPINAGAVLNTAASEAGAALSFDGTTLYFQSARPGGSGAFDLYESTRMKVTGPPYPDN